MSQKPRIYLDNCCFNRPFDDQSHLSIHLETRAKLMLQYLVKDAQILLLWSFMLDYENQANPDIRVKSIIKEWKRFSCSNIRLNDSLLIRARYLQTSGIDQKDALHISAAIEGTADAFITVDRGIIKKSNMINQIVVYNPIEYIAYLEKYHAL